MNKQLIKKCAKLCELSYSDSFPYQELGYLGQKFIENEAEDAQCHILYDQLYTYIVFRGTEPSHLKDWITDLKFCFDDTVKTYGVHHGFKLYVDALYPQIKAELDKTYYNGKKIIITGHSLGGAAAVIFSEKISGVENVITFGQPRVGDKRMMDSNAHNDILIRVVNEGDPVTLLPPYMRGYRFWGECLYFTSKGRVTECPGLIHRWFSFLKRPKLTFLFKKLSNHSIEKYNKHATHL